MYNKGKIDIKDMVFFCLGIQSTDHGALIGGILGGICFLAVMAFVCILVAMKRRQSSAGILFHSCVAFFC